MKKFNIDWSTWLLEVIFIALVLMTALWCPVQFAASLRAEKLCLQHGWKDAKVTWDLTAYCVREENEYEIVKPLAVIMGKE